MLSPCCLPVLIGSLPLTDHHEALQLVLDHTPDLPLWPQLPKNPKEGMIRQFLDGLPALVDTERTLYLDTDSPAFGEHTADFYEEYLALAAEPTLPEQCRFALTPATAKGFFVLQDYFEKRTIRPLGIKGQITGPVTAGLGVRDRRGVSILYDDTLRDVLTKLFAMKARWQVERLKPLAQTAPLVFIDEPVLVNFGSTAFAGVTEELAARPVGEIIEAIHRAGGMAGIHICANGDWGPALASAADLISFDAYSYFDNFILYRDRLLAFVERGGMLAWGIVPTGDPEAIAKTSADRLFNRWARQLEHLAGLGLDRRRLLRQTFIAPACGTGSLSRDLAVKVLRLTAGVSELARTVYPPDSGFRPAVNREGDA